MDIQEIHESLVNGQRKQMVKQIDEYESDYGFWVDYKDFLEEMITDINAVLDYYTDANISYHRIKGV